MTLDLVPFRGHQVPVLNGHSEISRYSMQQYLNDLSFKFNGQTYYGSATGITTTYNNKPAEPISNNFEGFVTGMLFSDGPVASAEAYRLRVFGQAPLLYQELVDGRPGDLFDDDALERLREPWPTGNLGDLAKRALVYGDFGGNAFVLDMDDELVLVRPDWCEIVLAKREFRGGQVGWRQVGIVYYEGGLHTGDGVPFAPGEYCHFVPGLPDPLATYRGMSWLTPLVREVQADKGASDHKLAFFENAASPNLAVSLPKEITKDQFDKFVEAMDNQHKGSLNAYKTLYTAGGADVTVIGANMQQMDFAAVQGKGETRIANAAGVPPTLLSFSEGMQGSSLNAGNYTAAKRNFVDTTMRDLWQNWAGSLQKMDAFRPPKAKARLWYDGRDIPFLHEDAKDRAEIQQIEASTLSSHISAGWKPDSAVLALLNDDLKALEHTGLTSVQLLPPGQQDVDADGVPDAEAEAEAEAEDQAEYDALLEEFRAEFWDEDEIQRDRYDVRNPRGSVGGGRFRKLSDAIKALLKDWDGTGDPLEGYNQKQLKTAATQLGIDVPPRSSAPKLKAQILGKLRGDRKPDVDRPDANAPAKKAAPRTTAEHVAALGEMNSHEDVEAYLADVKGAELDALAHHYAADYERSAKGRRAAIAHAEGWRITRPGAMGSDMGKAAAGPTTGTADADAPAPPPRKRTPAKKAAPKPAERLAEALAEAGWTATTDRGSGIVTYRDPGNDREIPTPDYVTKSMWPGETYTHQRSVTIVPGGNGRPASVLIREHRTPWVTASQRPASYKAAIEFVTADDPRPGAPPKPDPVSDARTRQDAIDSARRFSDAAAQLDQLVADEASDEALLHRLDAVGRRHGIEGDLAPVRAALAGDADAAREVEVENRIRAAYRQLAMRPNSYVGIADLRAEVSRRSGFDLREDIPSAEVDAALRRMATGTRPDAALVPNEDQKRLTPRDRAESVRFGDRENHLVAMANPSDRPMPGARDAARRAMDTVLAAHGITRDGQAGDRSRYTPSQHQPIDGSLREGRPVQVVRPGFTLTRPGDPATVREIEVENRIRAAYRKLAKPRTGREGQHGWVDFRRLRAEVGGDVSREEFDATVKRLDREGAAVSVPEENRKAVTQADIDAGVRFGTARNESNAIAFIEDPTPRALDRDGEKVRLSKATVEAADGDGPKGPGAPPVPTPDPETARDALDLKKVPELKAMLRERGLPVSGRKRELVDRLVGDLHPGDSPTEAREPDDTPPMLRELERRSMADLRRLAKMSGSASTSNDRAMLARDIRASRLRAWRVPGEPNDDSVAANADEELRRMLQEIDAAKQARFDAADVAEQITLRMPRATEDEIVAALDGYTVPQLRRIATQLSLRFPRELLPPSGAFAGGFGKELPMTPDGRRRYIAQNIVRDRSRWSLRSEEPDPDDIERADYDEPDDDDPGEPDDEMRARAKACLDDCDEDAEEPEDGDYEMSRAAGADTNIGGERLHYWWTKGPGLKRWAGSPHPWTTLYTQLLEKVGNVGKAKRMASRWFIEVFGYAAGSDKHRVASGKPPRGDRIGPG